MIDAVDVEFPGAVVGEGALDGDAIADFPAEAVQGSLADNGALAVFQKGLPLIFGNHQFGDNLALVFGVDHELGEKILLVLIHAAEPVVVGDRLHAGNAQDFVAIGKWNGLMMEMRLMTIKRSGAGQFGRGQRLR